MLIQIAFLVLGFVLLIQGANWLVDGASSLAKKFNISDLAIGLTVVAFGTSAPEMVVNVFASAQNHQDIVLGNIIGSNFFNLFAILGLTGVLYPLTVKSNTVWKEIPFSLLAVIVLFFVSNDFVGIKNIITRWDALIMLSFFGLFLFYVYKQLKQDKLSFDPAQSSLSNVKIWIFIIIGLAGLVIGGKLVVNSGIYIAKLQGLSEKVIGLTIIAAGTSLPELVTSVVAVIKKNNDIAVGNVIGSNIFNIFLILPVSTLIKPIHYKLTFNTDLYVLFLGTLFLFIAMFTGKKKKLDRWEAGLLLVTFIAYTVVLIV